MKERIESIIKHECLTPSQLADAIGVQRSGISHILSGRNKPSVDFLYKLLNRFPHISGDWLITGEGDMLHRQSEAQPVNKQLSLSDLEAEQALKPKPSFKMPARAVKEEDEVAYQKAESELNDELPEMPFIPEHDGKRIERIVVFYNDKTFMEYHPGR